MEDVQTSEGQLSDALQTARVLLAQAVRVVVITGAGVSQESGLPTYRSPTSNDSRAHEETELGFAQDFTRNRWFAWLVYNKLRDDFQHAKPNEAHRAIARWSRGRVGTMVATMNIDDLHEQAGQNSLVRIHGSLWRNRCTKCGRSRENREEWFEDVPRCRICGGWERPDVVWFGEDPPHLATTQLRTAAANAQVILIVGSSVTVSSVRTPLLYGKVMGAKLIYIDPHPAFQCADVTIVGRAAEFVPKLLA